MFFSKNFILITAIALLNAEGLWASSNGAQQGLSGRPGDGNGCTQCHDAVSQAALIPSIAFTAPDTINVGESVIFTLDVTSNDSDKSGFVTTSRWQTPRWYVWCEHRGSGE